MAGLSIAEQILENVASVLVANTDPITFSDVQRLNDAGGIVARYPTAQVWISNDATVGTDLYGSIDIDVRKLRLVVRCWVANVSDLPGALEEADLAATVALHADGGRGGLARHTQRTGSVLFAPADGTGIGYTDIAFDVDYAVNRKDPREQA